MNFGSSCDELSEARLAECEGEVQLVQSTRCDERRKRLRVELRPGPNCQIAGPELVPKAFRLIKMTERAVRDGEVLNLEPPHQILEIDGDQCAVVDEDVLGGEVSVEEMRRVRRIGPQLGEEALRTVERLADQRSRRCDCAQAILHPPVQDAVGDEHRWWCTGLGGCVLVEERRQRAHLSRLVERHRVCERPAPNPSEEHAHALARHPRSGSADHRPAIQGVEDLWRRCQPRVRVVGRIHRASTISVPSA